jgi:hypothetical protein
MEYKWKEYTLDQNVENKINNKAEDGWTVNTVLIRQWGVGLESCVIYVLYERET